MFWPPVILLLSALALSLLDFGAFHAGVSAANNWILSRFDWLFSLASFAAVLLTIWIFGSSIGKVRIGGASATPILSRWHWFAITLCTTIAIGILFWGAAEPIYHVDGPPDYTGISPNGDAAARFAISSMFMHWTITPYAIYSVPALAFALAYYNLGRPYSLSGPLSIVFGRAATGRGGAIIDAIGLYALVAGVAASLGAGVMTLAGGVENLSSLHDTVALRFFITVAIVSVFVISSISGVQKGIKVLSDLNVKFFVALAAFVLIAGPTWEIVSLAFASLGEYLVNFIPRSLALGDRAGDEWTRDWTVFYFANWLAWAPITALFLGRISVGYTVREFLIFNLILPASFSAIWMSIFGGAAISLNANDGALSTALENSGPEAAIYALFEALPFTGIVAAGFVLVTFVSFATAMDSNTHSIASVCTKSSPKTTSDEHRASIWLKIFWGALVGAIAFTMTATTGIDGVRMLSNLGGLPGLFILIAMGAVLIVMRASWFEEVKAARQPAR